MRERATVVASSKAILQQYNPHPWAGTSPTVKGSGCRPLATVGRAPGAGVRKPPGKAPASGEAHGCRERYGDLGVRQDDEHEQHAASLDAADHRQYPAIERVAPAGDGYLIRDMLGSLSCLSSMP